MATIIEITSKDQWLSEREKDITSTEVSALFGLNKYLTKFQLYHIKKGTLKDDFVETDRTRWGNRLEAAIAQGFAEDHGFKIKPMKYYMRDEKLRAGSSFDFEIIEPEDAILEIKNVDSLIYRNEWEDGEAPFHIELQVQHQLMITGKKKAYIGALIGGNTPVLIERTPSAKIISSIIEKITEFWAEFEAGKEPSADFENDSAAIKQMYSYAHPGKVSEIPTGHALEHLAFQHKAAMDKEKAAGKEKDRIKTQMLTMIGDNEKLLGDSYTISAGLIGPKEMSFTRKGYRNFKISWKKRKDT